MIKKSFKDNPALRFISQPQPAAEGEEITPEKGAPVKLNPLYVETKSKRLQLLLRPSLHRRLKERAQKEGHSLNGLIHSILDEWLRKSDDD